MFYKAKQMLKKARQGKHGNHPTIFSRWYEQEGHLKSLAEHNIDEKEVMLVDHISLERHDDTANQQDAEQVDERITFDAEKRRRTHLNCMILTIT